MPSEIKANNVGELEKHKDKPVIVVDGSGMQCQEPANALTKAGFAQVFVLKEGVAGWAGENGTKRSKAVHRSLVTHRYGCKVATSAT